MFKIIIIGATANICVANYITKDELIDTMREMQAFYEGKTLTIERMTMEERFHRNIKA